MQISAYLIVLIGTWIAWSASSLFQNYKAAKSTKLPVIISPISPLNPAWLIIHKLLFPGIIPSLQRLPIGTWPRCTYFGWQFEDKRCMHAELGPAFVLCTPGINEVVVADHAIIHQVLTKRKDFVKPAIIYDALNAFGENLDSVEGEKWQRHRKITAPSFNESVSASVWTESGLQAKQVLSRWTQASRAGGTKDTVQDTASLALNVLTYAAFGIKNDFDQAHSEAEIQQTLSYREALGLILQNFTLVAALPMAALKIPILPRSVRRVGEACDQFKTYIRQMLDQEKTSSDVDSQGVGRAHNLVGALLRASEAEEHGLTEQEIYGNIFIYNLAGHETTANTVATSIAYLAVEPKWQDWLHEEVTSVVGAQAPLGAYEAMYPRLKRCQAVMLETLRLHGSIVYIPKATVTAQLLVMNEEEHVIPANTFVTVNSQAVHCDPQIWGQDALEWRPDRWIAEPHRNSVGEEQLIEPRSGTFVAWAEGPRICPGKKFSQVEFTAVLATLFHSHRVKPTLGNADKTVARSRLISMIEDSAISAITLQMKRPKDVAFIWEPR